MSETERDPFPVGSPAWADWWENRWGRENLDPVTISSLDAVRCANNGHQLEYDGSCGCGEVS